MATKTTSPPAPTWINTNTKKESTKPAVKIAPTKTKTQQSISNWSTGKTTTAPSLFNTSGSATVKLGPVTLQGTNSPTYNKPASQTDYKYDPTLKSNLAGTNPRTGSPYTTQELSDRGWNTQSGTYTPKSGVTSYSDTGSLKQKETIVTSEKKEKTPAEEQQSEIITTPVTKPWLDSNGIFNRNYIPTREQLGDPSLTDWQRNIISANYYNELNKGSRIDSSGMPESETDYIDQQLREKYKQESELDRYINSQVEKANRAAQGERAGIRASLSEGREGPMSQGNTMTMDRLLGFNRQDVSNLIAGLNEQKRQRQEALNKGATDLAARLGESIAAQEAAVLNKQLQVAELERQEKQFQLSALADLKTMGALDNADDETLAYYEQSYGIPMAALQSVRDNVWTTNMDTKAKEKWAKTKDVLTTFSALASEGTQLSTNFLKQTAKDTGIPLETLLDYQEQAQIILNDKGLDQETKAANLRSLNMVLERQARGITNASLENIDYLESLYRRGASQGEILRAKRSLGISDMDDPLYVAELTIKSAEANLAKRRANGEAVTPDDISTLLDAKIKQAELTGMYGVVSTDSKAKYEMVPIEGGVKVDVDNGAMGGECGTFVNDVFGTRIFKDSYDSKLALVDPNIVVPTPGMAFVDSAAGKAAPWGHVGIVEKVNANGTMDIVESNYTASQKVNRRTIAIASVDGFVMPPKATALGGARGDVSQMSDSEILTAWEEAGEDLSPDQLAKAIQLSKQTGYLPGARKATTIPTEYQQRLDDANSGESKQVRDANTETMINAAMTGDKQRLESAIYEIELKKFQPRAQKIKDSFDAATKDYNTLRDKSSQMSTLLKAYQNGDLTSRLALDQGVITLYNKMVDPSSVVRESEYARTPEGVSMMNRIEGYYTKLAEGGAGITIKDVEEVVKASEMLMKGAQAKYDIELNKAKNMGKTLRLPEKFLLQYLGFDVAPPVNYQQSLGEARKSVDSVKQIL